MGRALNQISLSSNLRSSKYRRSRVYVRSGSGGTPLPFPTLDQLALPSFIIHGVRDWATLLRAQRKCWQVTTSAIGGEQTNIAENRTTACFRRLNRRAARDFRPDRAKILAGSNHGHATPDSCDWLRDLFLGWLRSANLASEGKGHTFKSCRLRQLRQSTR